MGERGGWAAVQDPRRPARYVGRRDPAQTLDRRDPAALERVAGRDEPRRAAPAAASRLPAARGLAPKAKPRAAGHDGALADLRPIGARLRRPRPARFLLHRELVDLARHLDPRKDVPRGAHAPGRLLGRFYGCQVTVS